MRNIFLIYLQKVNSLLQTHKHTHSSGLSEGDRGQGGTASGWELGPVTRATLPQPAMSQARGVRLPLGRADGRAVCVATGCWM